MGIGSLVGVLRILGNQFLAGEADYRSGDNSRPYRNHLPHGSGVFAPFSCVLRLGIAAITWIAVKEQTHEIGTRRALGATRGDIFFQVSIETGALALTGCVLGVAISLLTSRLISGSVGLPFVFDRGTAASAFAAAMTIDFFFSVFPSRKAASVSPMEALRYE
jgi:putative ABC transport system permease protein